MIEEEMNQCNDDDDDDESNTNAILLEFFHQATQSLNQLMKLYQHKSFDVPTADVVVVSSDIPVMDDDDDNNNSNEDLSISVKSLSEIRHLLLSRQRDCLQSSIDACRHKRNDRSDDDYTVTTLQDALHAMNTNSSKSTTISYAMEQMNETARRTFCYITLWYEFQYDLAVVANIATTMTTMTTTSRIQPQRILITSSSSSSSCVIDNNNDNNGNRQQQQQQLMKSSEILEFCGLCSTAVRIPDIIQYLQYGTPIFPKLVENNDGTNCKTTTSPTSHKHLEEFPQERLQYIQRLLLRAIGYDPDYGTQLIQSMFYNNDNTVMIRVDTNVISTFRSMEACMEQTLREITQIMTQKVFHHHPRTNDGENTHNDDDDDDDNNVTRIVSVTYSEKYIDVNTGQELMNVPPEDWNDGTAPQSFIMTNNEDATITNSVTDHDRNDVLVQQTTILQQEILGELLSMREEEREIKLMEVNVIVQNVIDHIAQLEQPTDRILYMTRLDANTQRCMAMKKIWDNLLASHDNQAPHTIY